MESGILGFGIRDYSSRTSEYQQRLESRIQVPLTNTRIQYLESGIHGVESRIQVPVTNTGIPVPGIRNPRRGIPNPSSTEKYWNPVPGIRNPRRGIQNPRLSWIPLHGATPKCNSCFLFFVFGIGLWLGYLNAYSIILSIVLRNECYFCKRVEFENENENFDNFQIYC